MIGEGRGKEEWDAGLCLIPTFVTMKKSGFFLVLFLVACGQEKGDPSANKGQELSKKRTERITVQDSKEEDEKGEEKEVSKEFGILVAYIDSIGFTCDTGRFEKTYGQAYERSFQRNGHHFYEFAFEETAPIKEASMGSRSERVDVDKELLGEVERILAHFHVDQRLFEEEGRGSFPDGIIEEWRFPDSTKAERAAEWLAQRESFLYINRGAYICYLRNRMYVLHSRSAGFYTHLKRAWKHFGKREKVKIPFEEEQRGAY